MHLYLVGLLTVTIASCSPAPIDVESTVDPSHRAVLIQTTGCGFSTGRTGSGIAIGDGLILTAAHLVARADTIDASVNRGPVESVVVSAIDLRLDLALLKTSPNGVPEVITGSVAKDATGEIVAGASSGTVPFTVKRLANLFTEDILGTEQHSRHGYELDAITTTGDSGAGAYDSADQLVGMVFATGLDSTWITASSEIDTFLAEHTDDATPLRCDPERSQLDLP